MARPERLFTEMKPYLDGQHTVPEIAKKVKATPAAIYAAVRRGGFQSQVKWADRRAGVQGMTHVCETCKRQFSNPISLSQHKKAVGHGAKKKAHSRPNGKVANAIVTREFLLAREARAAKSGFGKAKWIAFCEAMDARALEVSLYEARKTFSKYLTVSDGSREFKVRFSNHAPIKAREQAADCDFFVGVCNFTTTTTEQAISAVDAFFGREAAE